MRVAFFTNLTAQVSLPVLKKLADSPQLELRHVFFYDTLSAGRKSPGQILRQFGPHALVAKALGVLLGKFRIAVARHCPPSLISPRSAYEFAVMRRLSHSLVEDLNAPPSRVALQTLQVDVLLVCVCKNILRREVLNLPGLRCINIHPSLLPHYRGPLPTFWMRFHGEKLTGYTIHCMTEKIDQGAVLDQRSLPLDIFRSDAATELEVFSLAAENLETVLLTSNNLNAGPSTLHDEQVGSYHGFPTPSERQELKRRLAQFRQQAR